MKKRGKEKGKRKENKNEHKNIKKKNKKNIEKNLILEFVLFAFAVLSIAFFWRNNVITTWLLIFGWLVAILLWHKKEDILFFVAAAVLGLIIELIGVHFGVWAYGNPSWLGIPVWIPLAYGYSSIVISKIGKTISNFGFGQKVEKERKTQKYKKAAELIIECILYVAAVSLMVLLWKNNIITLIMLLIIWLIAILIWHRKIDILFFIIGCVICPIVDFVNIPLGVWTYTNPSFIIPIWLPLFYGFGSVLSQRIVKTILRK